MPTRMTSKLEVFNARLLTVEASLKNQEAMVTSHDSTLKEHSGLLTEITKTLAILKTEMREGFQQQSRREKGKDKVGLSGGGSPAASFDITDEGV